MILRSLNGINAIGGDVCEVAPSLDPSGLSQLNAANPRGHMGESVDIVCDAVAGERVEGSPIVRVVIELKCCWHADLDKAMKEQLVDRYLDGDHRQGIYAVALFDSADWDDSDSANRRRCRRRDPAATRAFFENQAKEIAADGVAEVSAFVLDCSL